jgi:hypothetical protein
MGIQKIKTFSGPLNMHDPIPAMANTEAPPSPRIHRTLLSRLFDRRPCNSAFTHLWMIKPNGTGLAGN